MSDEAVDKHRGAYRGEFCAVAGQPTCKCASDLDYRNSGECPPNWESPVHRFPSLKKNRKTGLKELIWIGYQAHHILCIACVSKTLVKKEAIKETVAATRWCINDGSNMLAMPMWGQTVNWYMNATTGAHYDGKSAPPWKNIAQHDWDHTGKVGYNKEVTGRLKSIAKTVKDKGHDATSDDLIGDLKAALAHFKSELKVRATRCDGGTHAAWKKGRDVTGSDWYKSFSMSAKPSSKSFPGKAGGKIKAMTAALTGG